MLMGSLINKRQDLASAGSQAATTKVADGPPCRAWTVDDVEHMVEVGILQEDEPFELWWRPCDKGA